MLKNLMTSFPEKKFFFNDKKILRRRSIQPSILSPLILSACGKDTTSISEETEVETITSTTALTPILSEGVDYISVTSNNEIISTTNTILTTIELISDDNTTDKDQLNITTETDVANTPEISGFELIDFSIGDAFTNEDDVFNVDLGKISSFDTISFSNPNKLVNLIKISVVNAKGNMKFSEGFTDLSINSNLNENIEIETSEDSTVTVFTEIDDLTIKGGGNSLNISTSNLGIINVTNNSGITLNAAKAKESINLVSNGDVTVSNATSVIGNIDISAIGKIDLQNTNSASGKLTLDNLRAAPGTDISVSHPNLFKSVDIKSTGAVNANQNSGFKNADTISITVAKDSNIHAISDLTKSVSLSAVNQTNTEVTVNIDIDGMTNLALGGTAPILVTCDGADLNKTVVTTTNSTETSISITSANTDVSNIEADIEIRLNNLDGKKITVGQNQNLVIDAELPHTASTSTPEYIFSSPASSTSTNTVKLSTRDSNTSNTDSLANMAGLILKDIQTLEVNLADLIGLEFTQNIVGSDLQRVSVTGSGTFNLNSSTIIGAADGSVVLDASNLIGNLTLAIDNTTNAVKTITSGSGDDSITVDAVLSTGTGITVNSGDGYDTITLTSNSDGNNSILSINGGVGGDKIKFATGLDFSLSSMQLTAIESLEFTGGGNSTKLPSNVVSGQNFSIIENGTGTLTLEIFPTQQVLNLSTLVFDSSIASGTDKIIVNGSNFSNALTITGSIMDDEITGTHTSNDTISSGDGNDTIDGSDGNDTLTPGNGSDHITPGLGNDTIDLTEVVGAVDTLYFSIDDGATNVDIVTNFDVRVANDLISLDVSELSNPISFGNGSAATAAAAGTITIVEQSLNTNLNHSSNAAASIIKLNPTDKSTFATALGTSEITVANDATINFLWFDNTNKQAVFGYVNENSASPDENLIKAEDTFTEIVRLTITDSTYTHYLDNDNFIFI